MVGAALKKYAESHAMSCDGGYIYGNINGRFIALVDGIGVKMLQIYLCPPLRADDEILTLQVRRVLEECGSKEYRLIRQNAVNVGKGRAVVVFQDGIGAMDRIAKYIDAVLPRLEQLETGGDACACCGEPLNGAARHVLMDDYILPVHERCMDRMTRQPHILEDAGAKKSVGRGVAGAALGAAIGAVALAVVYLLGFVSGVAGLLVGFLTNWLYGKFGGRNGRVRTVAVAVAMILGVLAGQIAGITAVYSQNFDENGGADAVGLTRMQYIQLSWQLYTESDQTQTLGDMYDRMCQNVSWRERTDVVSCEEFIQANLDADYADTHAQAVREFWTDFSMGLFFGALGCLSLFTQMRRNTGRCIVRKLK